MIQINSLGINDFTTQVGGQQLSLFFKIHDKITVGFESVEILLTGIYFTTRNDEIFENFSWSVSQPTFSNWLFPRKLTFEKITQSKCPSTFTPLIFSKTFVFESSLVELRRNILGYFY